MKSFHIIVYSILVAFFCISGGEANVNVQDNGYKYWCYGNCTDVKTKTTAGFLLMGGGTDVDEGFSWMIDLCGGGNFVVIRTYGDDAYDPYIFGLGKVQSVATILITSEEGSNSDFVYNTMMNAEALFIAGGDQWSYVTLWNNTKVKQAIESLVSRNVPIGGTSAGLMVLGQYVYTADTNNSLTSDEALQDPFTPDLTLGTNLFSISKYFTDLLFDTHFFQRDRMGRSITFLARMLVDYTENQYFVISVDESTAICLDASGYGRVVNLDMIPEHNHSAYFITNTQYPQVCKPDVPLTFDSVSIQRLGYNEVFDFVNWTPLPHMGTAYSITAKEGDLSSTQKGGGIY